MYKLAWYPGQENLADYQSKHHVGSHHVAVRPWYLHMNNSPRVLPRAERPSALKGCVGTLKDGYVRKVPLPRAPRIQHARSTGTLRVPSRSTSTPVAPRIQHAKSTGTLRVPSRSTSTPVGPSPLRVTPIGHDTCYLAQVPRIPTWSDLTRSIVGLGRRTLLPFSPLLV